MQRHNDVFNLFESVFTTLKTMWADLVRIDTSGTSDVGARKPSTDNGTPASRLTCAILLRGNL